MPPFAALYDYLVKARGRLLDWVRQLTPEQYSREYPDGLKTMHATLVHIASAEWAYGNRLRGRQASPAENPFTVEKIKTFTELEAAWKAMIPDTRAALSEVSDWSAPVEYRMTPPNAPAVRIRATKAGIASQLVVHEVHHRAKIMAMLRQCGIAAQNLDYSAIMFERQQETA